MQKEPFYHKPVLLSEALSALNIQPEGVFVDATFGGGGHARAILERLDERGRLIAFDQDEDAWRNLPEDKRIELVPENFRYLGRFLKLKNRVPVSGILADLGVSSHQFDTAERGFSIRADAPLDMRMDRRQGMTAVDVVQQYEEAKLWQIFEEYGEVRNARSLAAHLVKERKRFPLTTVGTLKAVLRPMIMGNERRYLAQVFQAIRIEVNDELGALQDLLEQSASVLKPGGRLAIITFHSLEDRMVKRFMKRKKSDSVEDVDAPVEQRMQAVFKKPIIPTRDEIKQNPRAGSAKLRVAEKMIDKNEN